MRNKPVGRPDDKVFSIVVNGRQRNVESEELTFDELVDLGFRRIGEGAADRVHDNVQGGRRPDNGR